MAKKRIKNPRVTASVPKYLKDEIDRLSKSAYMSESHLIMLMIVHAMPWAQRMFDDGARDAARSGQPEKSSL